MSQARPDSIETLIDRGAAMRVEDDAAAFLVEVAEALQAREITETQAYALAGMLGFSRDLFAVARGASN